MRIWTKARLRLRSLLRREMVEQELETELRFHLEGQIDEYILSGMAPDEARRAALRAMGGLTQFQEECRDMRRVNWIDNIGQDLRFGLRTLRNAPVFTAVAILTLALGIGANTAIFSVVQAALLRSLPYAEPDRLITIGEVRGQQAPSSRLGNASWSVSYPDYLDWKAQSKMFASLAGFTGDGFTLRGMGEPETVIGVQATANFFSTFGVTPVLGRDFRQGEDAHSSPSVAILTYSFWTSRFGADPHVIGRSIQLDSDSVTVIGVLPASFEFAPRGSAQLWVPLHMSANMVTRRGLRWLSVVGRLARSSRAAQATAEFNLINAQLAAAHPREDGSIRIVMASLRDRIVGPVQALILVLFGAVGFVLLIACANVANLMMARAARRRKEFAVRTALGAGRGRLIAQLLSESLILAAAGGLLGIFLARWGTRMLIAAIPARVLNTMPFLRDAHADTEVLAFLFGITVLTGVAFGLAPALEIFNRNVGGTLKDESRGSTGGIRTRLRQGLVVAEIAFSLVLLVGAGLMMKSLAALLNRDPGFETRGLLTFSVFLPDSTYPKTEDVTRFDRQFTDRIRSLAGVEGIAEDSVVPLTGGGNTIRFVVEGHPTAAGQENECYIRDISANYFPLMKIPLIAGRLFNESDNFEAGPFRVMVSQSWVNKNLPGENPIGKRIRFTNSPTQPYREIIGVVGDVAEASLESAKDPILFTPYLQGPGPFLTYIVRTTADPASAMAPVRAALRSADPQLIPIQPATMSQIIDQSPSVFLRRYPSFLIGSFAALALILAIVGLYGLISYSVSQRSREVGIRIALGAQPLDVLRLVLGEGIRLTMLGIAMGMVAALGLTQLMRSLLFGVSVADPLTFGGVAVLLALAAIAACYIPARRAMGADPIGALRHE